MAEINEYCIVLSDKLAKKLETIASEKCYDDDNAYLNEFIISYIEGYENDSTKGN